MIRISERFSFGTIEILHIRYTYRYRVLFNAFELDVTRDLNISLVYGWDSTLSDICVLLDPPSAAVILSHRPIRPPLSCNSMYKCGFYDHHYGPMKMLDEGGHD